MTDFALPDDLAYNRGPVTDPAALAEEVGAASWLFLCGEEFAAMGGLTFAEVEASVGQCENVVSDPPVVLDLEIARRQVAALDRLPRPTLVTCRAGPRASATVYLYAGLRSGATAEAVLAAAEADDAPFATVDEYRAFVSEGLAQLD